MERDAGVERGAKEEIVHPHVHAVPSWLRPTAGEHRWQMSTAVVVAIALQVVIPGRLGFQPRWVMPSLEGLMLVALWIANPGRIDSRTRPLRTGTILLVAAISFANAWSLVLLTHGLVTGKEGQTAGPLLLTGGAIWGTNVIAFAFWYWEFDRGGPAERALGRRPHPDFMFPQMAQPELAPHDWEPQFFDYVYTSFTNATAFSPTDVMPLSRWAKLIFLCQSSISLITAALIVARAVNILR